MSKEHNLENEDKALHIGGVVGSTSKCFLIDKENKYEDISDNLWRCMQCKREIHIMSRFGKDDVCR